MPHNNIRRASTSTLVAITLGQNVVVLLALLLSLAVPR